MKAAKFECYRDREKKYRWRLIARNGKIAADSGESYHRPGACVAAAARIVRIAHEAALRGVEIEKRGEF